MCNTSNLIEKAQPIIIHGTVRKQTIYIIPCKQTIRGPSRITFHRYNEIQHIPHVVCHLGSQALLLNTRNIPFKEHLRRQNNTPSLRMCKTVKPGKRFGRKMVPLAFGKSWQQGCAGKPLLSFKLDTNWTQHAISLSLAAGTNSSSWWLCLTGHPDWPSKCCWTKQNSWLHERQGKIC